MCHLVDQVDTKFKTENGNEELGEEAETDRWSSNSDPLPFPGTSAQANRVKQTVRGSDPHYLPAVCDEWERKNYAYIPLGPHRLKVQWLHHGYGELNF
jgi:hypothetical protein